MRKILVFCLVVVFSACSKDGNEGETKTQLLTSSQWKYENGGIDQDKNGSIDIPFSLTGMVEPCMTDNTGLFNANGTGVMDEGPTKCDPMLPQSTNFTWSFQNNETTLHISGSGLFGLGGNFAIKTLNATSFHLAKDTTINFGGMPLSVALIFQLKH